MLNRYGTGLLSSVCRCGVVFVAVFVVVDSSLTNLVAQLGPLPGNNLRRSLIVLVCYHHWLASCLGCFLLVASCAKSLLDSCK